MEKGKYVTRSVYQKVFEENKRLLADIKLLTDDSILNPEKILLTVRWREKFEKDKELNDMIVQACKDYLVEHPEYDITKNFQQK